MLLHNHIETIIFDLDGTLRHNVPSADETMLKFAIQLGANPAQNGPSKAARWAHYYWAQSSELLEDINAFGSFEKSFWSNYARRYLIAMGVPEPHAAELAPALAERMETGFVPQSIVHSQDLEALALLKKQGYTVGLVSNRSSPFQEEIQQLGLTPHLDFAYVAAEVNTWKPDPAIFNRALEITRTPPERVVYIGDNYYADIVGARAAGFQAVLMDPREVFPTPDCPVVRSVSEFVNLLPPRE